MYKNVIALTAGRPCMCVHVPRRRPNEFHDMRTCALANILEGHHHGNKLNWKQSDPAKWMNPILGPWEMAKLFLPDLGGHTDMNSADDMDITGILNLMYWCNHFTIPQHLIQVVRETRNNKWVHVPKLELSDADKTDAFDAIENLLKDSQLAPDPDSQKALKEIANLKSVTDLHSIEAQVLADFKEVINKEISNLTQESQQNKEQVSQLKQQQLALEKAVEDLGQRNKLLEQLQNKEILNLSLESERNKEHVSQLKQQQVILEKAVEDLGQRNKLLEQFHVVWVWQLLVYAFGGLITSVIPFRRGILLLFLFWNFCSILDDDTLIKEGMLINP